MNAPLNRDRILSTAIAIADRDGFEAVTLRRIAAELEVHVTSLYNHVPTREAITAGIVERLVEEAGLPSTPTGWEDWVRAFVAAIGDVAGRHPGAFVALQRRSARGPSANASFEVALTAFTSEGLSLEDAYAAVKATVFVALSIGTEKALESRREVVDTDVHELPPDEFPLVHAVAARVTSEDAAWAFTVDALVLGLRAQLAGR
jgi:AcrR family transcriptional regulator